MQKEYRSSPRDEAEERIESYIIEKSLQPNDRLPSERDLCRMWDFNRSTLHSAIARLIGKGLLYAVTGSGTYVSKPKVTRNLQDLKSFSRVVASYGRRLTTRVISMQIVESNKFISRNLRLVLGHKIMELTRLRIIDDVPAALETSYLDIIKYSGLEEHDFSRESLYSVLEDEYRVSIVKGEERVSITYATEEDSDFLGIVKGQAVFSLSGVVNDAEDVPVEYFSSLVRSDYVRFASELVNIRAS